MSLRWISALCAITLLQSISSYGAETSTSSDRCIDPCSPTQLSRSFTAVGKKAIPAVVFIRSEGVEDDENAKGMDAFSDEFFQRFFGSPLRPQKRAPQVNQGSGFFVSSDGYILTNAHVVKGASKIVISYDGGKELDATLIGADSHTDLAVIKVEGKDFPHLSLGDSDAIEIGEWVVAIGSPFQLEASLTVGVVSAKGRQDLQIVDFEDFIQTDAAINPGNSGGPLLNLDSEVIGINTAIVSKTGGYMGIGFAIPSNMAKNIMAQIIDKGAVTRGFLGVSLQAVDKDIADAFHLDKVEGVLVSEVVKGSPADKAGVKQGDIITEYNGAAIKSLGSFRNDVSLTSPGSTVSLKVNRNGKTIKLSVPLGTASDALSSSGPALQTLGIEIENLNADLRKQLGYAKGEEGIVITKVKPGSPAALAGLRPGFLILAVNHKKVSSIEEFDEVACTPDSKNRILLLIKHGSVTRFYSIKMP
jgi:serine protease Do